MLAQTAMSVVFVLAEKIRRGTDLFGNGGRNDYGFLLCPSIPEKCHSDDTIGETLSVERGKPLKR